MVIRTDYLKTSGILVKSKTNLNTVIETKNEGFFVVIENLKAVENEKNELLD